TTVPRTLCVDVIVEPSPPASALFVSTLLAADYNPGSPGIERLPVSITTLPLVQLSTTPELDWSPKVAKGRSERPSNQLRTPRQVRVRCCPFTAIRSFCLQRSARPVRFLVG